MLRPETHLTKIALGLACLTTAIVCYKMGHNIIGGAALGAAAPLLIKPSDNSAQILHLPRPVQRLGATLAISAFGTLAEIVAARCGHVGVGVGVNATGNIIASHYVPWADVWGWISRPKEMLKAGPTT